MSAKLSISFYIDLNTFIKKNAHSCAEHLHAMCVFSYNPLKLYFQVFFEVDDFVQWHVCQPVLLAEV